MGRRKIHSSDKNKLSSNEQQPKVSNRQLWKNKQEFVKSIVLKNIAVSMLFGALFWVIDALLDCLFFYEGTFGELLIYQMPPHEVYIRSVAIVLFLVFGLCVSVVQTRRQRALQVLQAANQQLQASEQQLRAANQQLRASQEEIMALAKFPSENPNPVLRISRESEVLYSNKAGGLLLANWKSKVGETIPERWRNLIASAFESEKGKTEEEEVKGKVFSVSIAPVKDVGYANLYARDITERKKAEQALRESEALLKATGRMAKVGGWEFDVETHNQTWTEEVYRIHEVGLDYKPTVSFGINSYHPEDREIIKEAVRKAIESGEPFDVELRIITAKGNLRWVHAIGRAYRKNGKIVKVGGTFQDTTERKKAAEELRAANQQLRASEQQLKASNQQLQASEQQLRAANQQLQAEVTERMQAEEKIKASLKEKEVLLKEVHHRVKNNMQVISSILNLQSRHIKNKHALEMFEDSQNRIKSMALVHEKLYESENLAQIDFAEYTRSMTSYLFSLYRIGQAIGLNIDIKGILLDVSTAIPCGLIINELISNSLKYAFPEGIEGEICIQLFSDKDGKVTLIVEDNGIGFPKDLDFRKTESLGMQLIIMLVEQLEGTVELDKSKGTRFKITF